MGLIGFNFSIKKQIWENLVFLAESEGFEPPAPCRATVFKTAALDHSANSPGVPGRSRTCDLLDRNQTLYPLSYEDKKTGVPHEAPKERRVAEREGFEPSNELPR